MSGANGPRMLENEHEVASPAVVNVEDLRSLARRRLPKAVFDYLEGGAEDEITLRENRRAFEEVAFRPRNAVAVAQCDLRTRVLGCDLAIPALLAPVGYSRLMHARGEVAAARAAGQAGTGYILSTMSGYSLEEVKAASTGPVFYQLYLLGGREVAEGALERARRAGWMPACLSPSTPPWQACASETFATVHEGTAGRHADREDSVFAANTGAPRLADAVSIRWRRTAIGQRGHPRQRSDAADRCGRESLAVIRDHLGGFALDQGCVARAGDPEGRAHRRRCPARGGCGSGGHRGVQPRRETTRRRASDVACAAGKS